MASSWMLRRVSLVRTDVSEECSTSTIRVTRIAELGTMLSVTSNRRTNATKKYKAFFVAFVRVFQNNLEKMLLYLQFDRSFEAIYNTKVLYIVMKS
jgi:hypothetical protein